MKGTYSRFRTSTNGHRNTYMTRPFPFWNRVRLTGTATSERAA